MNDFETDLNGLVLPFKAEESTETLTGLPKVTQLCLLNLKVEAGYSLPIFSSVHI